MKWLRLGFGFRTWAWRLQGSELKVEHPKKRIQLGDIGDYIEGYIGDYIGDCYSYT